MSVSPSAQDVADALAITLEREGASGAPWCPPADAAALRKWVINRSASLGTGIRRAVRLARLMAVADGRTDYIGFLYERVGPLRARQFRHILERAVAEGRLPRAVATLTENGVHLREPALTPQGAPEGVFEIDFAQMPRLAALLDILHNALGFATVADLMAPLLPKFGAPRGSADDVGRAVQAAFNAWLGTRLESANHILQAQRIYGFVVARGRVAPEAIDDEAIVLFWIQAAEADDPERVEGFRLYRTVAMAMLRYRRALRDAMAERHLEYALGRGLEAANDSEATSQNALRPVSYLSPLRALSVPPASRVKWLTAKEQQALRNVMGGPPDDGGAAEETAAGSSADADDVAWISGLGGDERFDLAHWLTLLRADVFGAAQASIVARLRKRADPAAAVALAMEALDAAAYERARNVYGEIRSQLHVESLAALALLMESGAAEAIILVNWLGGEAAVRDVVGRHAPPRADPDDDDEDLDEDDASGLKATLAPRLVAVIADADLVEQGPGRTIVLEAMAARRKVSRAGFRREDRGDPAIAEALRLGGAALFDIVHELDRLMDALATKSPAADACGDRERFAAAFRRIYLGAAR